MLNLILKLQELGVDVKLKRRKSQAGKLYHIVMGSFWMMGGKVETKAFSKESAKDALVRMTTKLPKILRNEL